MLPYSAFFKPAPVDPFKVLNFLEKGCFYFEKNSMRIMAVMATIATTCIALHYYQEDLKKLYGTVLATRFMY